MLIVRRKKTMEYCIEQIESILERKLLEAANYFGDRKIRVIDIGVFPWHKKIELSLLFSDEDAEIDDIAGWPHYDFSKMSEGGWDEAQELASDIAEIWEQDHDALPIFMDFGTAATSEKVINVVNRFNRASDFVVQVLDPDDSNSENYCA